MANPIDVREAVDRNRSIWKPHVEPGKIRLFKKLVLRANAIADRPVAFRLKEMPDVILFREDLVAAAEKAKLTGLRFVEPEKFNSL